VNERTSLSERIQTALQLDRAVRLVWKSAPRWTLISLFLVLVQGMLPLVGLYLMKRIVDAVAAGLAAPDRASVFPQVARWVLLAGTVALLSALFRSLAELASQAQSLVVTDAISDILHAQSIAVDLEYYEDPRYYDTLHRAQREAPFRPTRIVNGLVQVGQSGLSLLGIAAILFSFSWVIGFVLVAAALPGAIVRLLYARRLYGFEQKQTEIERRAWYYHWVMTNAAHAKEVRLFGLGSLFRDRFRGLREQLREGRLALVRRRSLADLLAQTIATSAIFGSFALICYQAIAGAITLGSVVMYYQGFQLGVGYLQGILRALAGLYEDNLFLSNFYEFLELAPKIRRVSRPRAVPQQLHQGIAFQGVSFAYPSNPNVVLKDIDLTLAPGEVIALVGENGSGKTTLIKLLCRLYDPSAGTISLDGIDLRELDPVCWRREISVIFQDYVHYHLSAWENIWLGNVELEPDRDLIVQAAQLSGADAMIRRLPQGYDTMLGHEFRTGQEISIGEWQKVALARAFLRGARIVVLDEPTSSLDPLAEAALFERFRELIKGRSGILISHRFSTVRMADTIYVLEGGRVTESGSHDELVRRGGTYSRLYALQARQYR